MECQHPELCVREALKPRDKAAQHRQPAQTNWMIWSIVLKLLIFNIWRLFCWQIFNNVLVCLILLPQVQVYYTHTHTHTGTVLPETSATCFLMLKSTSLLNKLKLCQLILSTQYFWFLIFFSKRKSHVLCLRICFAIKRLQDEENAFFITLLSNELTADGSLYLRAYFSMCKPNNDLFKTLNLQFL